GAGRERRRARLAPAPGAAERAGGAPGGRAGRGFAGPALACWPRRPYLQSLRLREEPTHGLEPARKGQAESLGRTFPRRRHGRDAAAPARTLRRRQPAQLAAAGRSEEHTSE